MTENKQIIIDGVDVSGCIYRQYDMCTATKDNYGDCSFYCKDYEMKDCYYKQLKRKEQECERWKKANNEKNELLAKMGCPTTATAKRKVFTLQQQLDQLKVAKEQAEQKLKQIEKLCIKNSSKSSFCNGIENKDMQKLAIRILQIVSEVK